MTGPLELLTKYQKNRQGVLLDSNLLLLLFLGGYDQRQIGTNRLAAFAGDDYDLIQALVDRFSPLITTPNILTEVSNLSGSIPEGQRKSYFASFAERVAWFDEQHVSSSTALQSRWARFGLTDAVIAEIAKRRCLVITDDFALSQSLQSAGIEALNFNHIREEFWKLD
ncbi:MAG: hypothetical protein WA655_17205 [Candidatus Korobacteraceae bacterium]